MAFLHCLNILFWGYEHLNINLSLSVQDTVFVGHVFSLRSSTTGFLMFTICSTDQTLLMYNSGLSSELFSLFCSTSYLKPGATNVFLELGGPKRILSTSTNRGSSDDHNGTNIMWLKHRGCFCFEPFCFITCWSFKQGSFNNIPCIKNILHLIWNFIVNTHY